MPAWTGKALCDSYNDHVMLMWTKDCRDANDAKREEQCRVHYLLQLLEGSIPCNIPDLIVYYTALCHISYVYSVPSADPFLHDRKGADRETENVCRLTVQTALRQLAAFANEFWAWAHQKYHIDIWPTTKQAHKRMKEF